MTHGPFAELPEILRPIAFAFSRRIARYGDTPAGVLWKNVEGQQLRFEVLAGVLDPEPPSAGITLNDFGCGYGAFYDFLSKLPLMPDIDYCGVDISPVMIEEAKKRIPKGRVIFICAPMVSRKADYTVVSGTFNLKMDAADPEWNGFVKAALRELWEMSAKGLAFNMLDRGHRDRQDGLYYADPGEFLDFCKALSGDVRLIDDYPLDEWTIVIRRPA